jgi:hypothetical protein
MKNYRTVKLRHDIEEKSELYNVVMSFDSYYDIEFL